MWESWGKSPHPARQPNSPVLKEKFKHQYSQAHQHDRRRAESRAAVFCQTYALPVEICNGDDVCGTCEEVPSIFPRARYFGPHREIGMEPSLGYAVYVVCQTSQGFAGLRLRDGLFSSCIHPLS